MASSNNPALKVVTGKVRLSYVHLFEPYSSDPDKEKSYSVCLLIPKDTPEGKKTIKQMRAAQQIALKDTFGEKIPRNWRDTIRDGDEEADLDTNPEFAGHYFVNVSAKLSYPPGIVDRQRQEILDSTEVYSGCYGRVSLVAFGFNRPDNKGVSFGLRNVQKLADGEPLGGGRNNPEDDFDEVDDDDDDVI